MPCNLLDLDPEEITMYNVEKVTATEILLCSVGTGICEVTNVVLF